MATLRARTTFFWGQRVINQGDLIDARDPVVKAARTLFDPTDEPTVEQATAAPGERRSVRIPKKES